MHTTSMAGPSVAQENSRTTEGFQIIGLARPLLDHEVALKAGAASLGHGRFARHDALAA